MAPESDGAVPLVIDGCAMMDCARQIATNAQVRMQSDPFGQLACTDGKIERRPPYLIGYRLLVDIVW